MPVIFFMLALGIIASAVASVVGFGIGSFMTPLLASQLGTKAAVVIVSIPHFVATSYRCWSLRKHIDRSVLIRFGFASAIGGLAGAALNHYVSNPALTLVFGVLLILAGATGVFGANKRVTLGRGGSLIAGSLSGLFGGLVGNQGGIRSAALLGFDLSKEAFVATATAIGVIIDLARIPIYLLSELHEIEQHMELVGTATLGVLIGTMLGMQCLKNVPEAKFRKVVSIAVLVLGLFITWRCLF